MSSIVIRDDDLSFWTSVDEIERLYKPLFDKKVKISFAVIPCAVKSFNMGNFNSFYQDEDSQMPIFENSSIVEYVKDKIKENLVEIMLHGYTHLYSFRSFDGKIKTATSDNLTYYRNRGKKVEFLGEFNNKNFSELNRKVKIGKEMLEEIFGIKVWNFVPPSNQISKSGIKAICSNGLNLSGFIGRKYNREISLRGLFSFLKIIKFKLYNKDITYPIVLDYGRHKELAGYSLTPVTNMPKYNNQIKYCAANNLPFQIATHYWELNEKSGLRSDFYRIVDELLALKFDSKFLMELLNG